MSVPSQPTWSKAFDSTSGGILLRVESSLTYNSVFKIEDFTLMRENSSIFYPLNMSITEMSFSYWNISSVHDRFIRGNTQIVVSYTWENVSLFSVISATTNNKTYFSNSISILIDYRKLLQGTIFFLKYRNPF